MPSHVKELSLQHWMVLAELQLQVMLTAIQMVLVYSGDWLLHLMELKVSQILLIFDCLTSELAHNLYIKSNKDPLVSAYNMHFFYSKVKVLTIFGLNATL